MDSLQPPAALVADADQKSNEALTSYVESAGWKAFAAYDSACALEILRSETIRLAIVDLELPAVGGIRAVREAWAGGRRFHVAFVNTAERPFLKRQCLALGALAYLTRPLSDESLSNLLRDALQRPVAPAAAAAVAPAGELSPGERVRLCIETGPSAGSYRALVVDQGPASLVLSAWAWDWPTDYVSLGTPVTVGFPAPGGWGEFQSRVTGSYMRGSVIEITLSRPGRVLYRQRRTSARLAAELRVHAWPAEGGDAPGLMVSGQTEDVGRRGLRACFRRLLAFEGPVMLSIPPHGEVEEARLRARRVWYEAVGETGREWHRYGFRFLEQTPEARRRLNLLLAYIKSQQTGSRTAGQQALFAESDPAASAPEDRGVT